MNIYHFNIKTQSNFVKLFGIHLTIETEHVVAALGIIYAPLGDSIIVNYRGVEYKDTLDPDSPWSSITRPPNYHPSTLLSCLYLLECTEGDPSRHLQDIRGQITKELKVATFKRNHNQDLLIVERDLLSAIENGQIT